MRHTERLAFLNGCGKAGRSLKSRVDCILLHPVIRFKHFDIKSFRSCARADEFRQGLPLVIALSQENAIRPAPGANETPVLNEHAVQARYDRYKDKDGKRQERTEWHNITCWVRLAEIASEYLRKGRAVYVDSSPRTESWDDKQSGQKRYQTYVSAADLVLLGGAN